MRLGTHSRSSPKAAQRTAQRTAQKAANRANTFSANARLDLLRCFDPLADLDWHGLSSLARQAREINLPAGRVLVRPPRRLRGVWYLSTGTLVDDCTGGHLRAGSVQCRLPVWPGHANLRSLTRVRLVFFDNACLPYLGLAASEPPSPVTLGSNDWLETLAASPLLQFLYQRRGAAGWQSWLRSFVELEVRPGTMLISKGSVGDYFYVVQTGMAVVSNESELARIGAGGFFGEDALLSGQRRNATVCMPGGGRVLRGTAAQLLSLVDDLWWVLARKSESWNDNNRLLRLCAEATTPSVRQYLDALPTGERYGLPIGSQLLVQDLLLLLMIHRGYSLVLREKQPSMAAIEN